jgi:hypothetical protein
MSNEIAMMKMVFSSDWCYCGSCSFQYNKYKSKASVKKLLKIMIKQQIPEKTPGI